MPINQPTVVDHVQRPFNQVNLSGAIINAAAPVFGEAIGQGFKDLMGISISTAGEDYTRTMAGVNQGAIASNADARWQQILSNPGSEGLASNLDYKRQVGASTGLSGDALEAWVNTSLGDTPVTEGMRLGGEATRRQQRMDVMPGGQPQQSGYMNYAQQQPPSSATNTPAGVGQVQQSPPLPEPPQPASAGVAQQVQQDIQQAQAASQAEIRPDTLPKAAAEVTTPPTVPGGLPGLGAPTEPTSPQQLPPLDKNKLNQQLQAYMVRQSGYLSMYRQMANAAMTGKMDPREIALAASLSNMRQAELTQMMQTVAPSIGLDMVDKDGQPITGQALEWGKAYSQLNRMSPDARHAFAEKHKGAYAAMQGAASNFTQLLGNMTISQASILKALVTKTNETDLISPEAAYTSWHNENVLKQKAQEFEKTYELDKNKASVEVQQTLTQIEGMKIANASHLKTLELISKYGPQEAALKIQAAQQEIRLNNQRLNLNMKKMEQDEMATIFGLHDKAVELEEKSGQVFYQQKEKEAVRLGKAVQDYEQKISTLMEKFRDLSPTWDTAKRAMQAKTRPATVDAWLQSHPEAMAETEGARDFATKFQVYFSNQPGYEASKEYYFQLKHLQSQRGKAIVQMEDALSRQAPERKDGIRELTGGAVKQALQRRIQESNKLRAKTKIRETGEGALDVDAGLVNDLVGEYGDPDGNGNYRAQRIWSDWESKALLHLAQGSTARLTSSQLEGVPVGGKKLKDALGARWGDFYNAYLRLYGEIK